MQVKEDNINKIKIRHRITHTEISYCRLYPIKSDGTLDFFSSVPDNFTMRIRGKILPNRRLRAKKIYLAESVIPLFHEGEVVVIYKNGDEVVIE